MGETYNSESKAFESANYNMLYNSNLLILLSSLISSYTKLPTQGVDVMEYLYNLIQTDRQTSIGSAHIEEIVGCRSRSCRQNVEF